MALRRMTSSQLRDFLGIGVTSNGVPTHREAWRRSLTIGLLLAKPLRAMNMPQPNRFDRTRRQFFQAAGVLSAATLVRRIPPTGAFMEDSSSCNASLPAAFAGIKPLGERVRPITPDEVRQRIERAQQLM